MLVKYYHKLYTLYNTIKFKKSNISIGKMFRIRGFIKLQIDKSAKLTIGDQFLMLSGGMFNSMSWEMWELAHCFDQVIPTHSYLILDFLKFFTANSL